MEENTHQRGNLGHIMSEPSIQENSSALIEFLSRSWSATSMQAFRRTCNNLDRGLQWSWMDQEVMNGSKDRKLRVNFSKVYTKMRWVKKKLLLKEKEKVDLNLNMAMSVAGVAAAVAALTMKSATANREREDIKQLAVAAAATLVATQCAEAAERMGAHQANVTSFIRSAVATVGPNDLVVLTAAAATTLRGRKAHHGRKELPALPCSWREFGFLHNKEMVSRGAELPTCINNGKTRLKILHVYTKGKQVCLKIRTKHLGGTFTTSKNYTIRKANELECQRGTCVTNEVNGFCFICIQTKEGAEIHISFKEYGHCKLWSSTIAQLLLLRK